MTARQHLPLNKHLIIKSCDESDSNGAPGQRQTTLSKTTICICLFSSNLYGQISFIGEGENTEWLLCTAR